jgi:hypothetical protein
MANLGSGVVGTVPVIETALAAKIHASLGNLVPEIGTWQVVWGPAVFKRPLSVQADNAMYVAQDTSDTSRYVVAIAGTNPYSPFDWIFEDGLVNTQVAWAFGGPTPGLSPKLATGTNTGLTIIQALTPGLVFPGGGTALATFLAGLPAGPLNITVAGHSLGGALSPVTALWLLQTQSIWDPTGRATISCLPSAGPTPGNQDFATLFNGSPVGAKTTRIHNSIDVVPHAWAAGDLAEIPTLYEPQVPPGLLVRGAVALASFFSQSGAYAQIIPGAPALQGTVDPALSTSSSDFTNFVNQVGFQHVDAYFTLLGIGQLSGLLADARASAATSLPQLTQALKTKLSGQLFSMDL